MFSKKCWNNNRWTNWEHCCRISHVYKYSIHKTWFLLKLTCRKHHRFREIDLNSENGHHQALWISIKGFLLHDMSNISTGRIFHQPTKNKTVGPDRSNWNRWVYIYHMSRFFISVSLLHKYVYINIYTSICTIWIDSRWLIFNSRKLLKMILVDFLLTWLVPMFNRENQPVTKKSLGQCF